MKNFFLSLLIFFLATLLFSEEFKQIEISVEPEFGILNGKIEESVIYYNQNNQLTYLSLLDWDIKKIFTYGTSVNINFAKYGLLSFSFVQGFSGSSGAMQDYDWLNPSGNGGYNPEWKKDPADEITNYSWSNNTLNHYSKFYAGLGGNIYLPAHITISPSLGFSSEYIKFTASDGYRIYKNENFNKILQNGDLVSYSQTLDAFTFGLCVKCETLKRAIFEIDLKLSPEANIEAFDYHIVRKCLFNDKLYHCFDFEGILKSTFLFNSHFGIGIKGFLQFIPNVYGQNWSKTLPYGEWDCCSEYGGSNRLLWSVSTTLFARF